jgi:multicomponent K+:H+ antiporter subunit G
VTTVLPLWVDALTAVLVLTGALAALAGSFGLVRLRTFYQRVHPPALASTLGTWALALATAVQLSFVGEQPFVHALLVAIFIALTAPVTTIFLMRAALFRDRVAGKDAPAPLAGSPERGA